MMPVIAFVTDLIFGTKIISTARSIGVDVQLARSMDEFRARLAAGSRLAIVDLNASGADPLAAICAAREAPGPPRVVGYLSHVQTELAAAARDAGADEVLPRSAFSSRLPELLAGEPTAAVQPPDRH